MGCDLLYPARVVVKLREYVSRPSVYAVRTDNSNARRYKITRPISYENVENIRDCGGSFLVAWDRDASQDDIES